jgi:hypothetical protein
MVGSLIIFGFCESIAIDGLVLYILRGGGKLTYIFSGVSLICFISNYPKFEFWQDLYQRTRVTGWIKTNTFSQII